MCGMDKCNFTRSYSPIGTQMQTFTYYIFLHAKGDWFFGNYIDTFQAGGVHASWYSVKQMHTRSQCNLQLHKLFESLLLMQ